MKERRIPTASEKELFQLIKKETNEISNIDDIKQFFKRRLSSRLFDINSYDEDGFTPLMIAALEFRDNSIFPLHVSNQTILRAKQVILLLLEHGANMNVQNNAHEDWLGNTALHLACKNSSFGIVSFLLENGADPCLLDAGGANALFYASFSGNLRAMKVLLELGLDVNLQDVYGFTAIHVALDVCRGHNTCRCITLLLKYGAQINIQNVDGATPIFLAVHGIEEDSDDELVLSRLLLNANADLNIPMIEAMEIGGNPTIAGDTPLHDAVRYGRIKVVQLLLEHHPNLSICNVESETALDLAKKLKILPIIKLIEAEFRHQLYQYLFYHWTPKKTPTFPISTCPSSLKRKFGNL